MLKFFHSCSSKLVMILYVIALVYVTANVSQERDHLPHQPNHPPHPQPHPSNEFLFAQFTHASCVIHHEGFSLAYDGSHHNPSWVYEHLTAENLKGSVDRSHYDFKEEDCIPPHLRASLEDYRGQGFDRGHMAPAANHRSSPESMDDTFFLSNVCPQCPQFNRGYWAMFEKYVRDLTKEYQDVHVITGPLYLPNVEEEGKRYVKYQVIGSNNVAVPTHFFKVIALDDWQGKREMTAYIMPNEPISTQTPFDSFKTTIQKVESVSGLICQFPPHDHAKLCYRN